MSVITIGVHGLEAFVVSVETDIARGLYHFDIVGLGDKTVSESKSRILSAIKNSGFASPKTMQQKITVLLSPAGIKKEGSHFDLPVAVSYLQAHNRINLEKSGFRKNQTNHLDENINPDTAIIGELSLNGKIQPVQNILLMVLTAKNLGLSRALVPKENYEEAKLIDGINILSADNLSHAISKLNSTILNKNELAPKPETTPEKIIEKYSGITPSRRGLTPVVTPFSDIIKLIHKESDRETGYKQRLEIDKVQGQAHAKRALEISLAGKHHVALYGPPGVGKSLIAKSIPELLPPLTREEAVECRIVRESMYGNIRNRQLNSDLFVPPFREPHHTSSSSAITGNAYRPGEISMAHNGILYLDEFVEFDRRALEALRQPLEDGYIKNHRVENSATLPASCTLVATMNLCKCGNSGSISKKCSCTANDILHYNKKISGALADRIDVWIPLREQNEKISSKETEHFEGMEMKKRILLVRSIQKARIQKEYSSDYFEAKGHSNYSKRSLKIYAVALAKAALTKDAVDQLSLAVKKLKFSGRLVDSVILVSQTIADIEFAEIFFSEFLSSDNTKQKSDQEIERYVESYLFGMPANRTSTKISSIKTEHVLEALSYRKKY